MGVGTRPGHIPSGNSPRQRGSQTQGPDEPTIKLIALGAALIAILVIEAVVMRVIPLSQPTPSRCPPTEQITIAQVTFGARAGQVSFAVWNSGTRAVTIVQAFAQGVGITGAASTFLSNSNIVPPSRTLLLNVTFPGVTFQNGTRYDLTLASACGNKFPTSANP